MLKVSVGTIDMYLRSVCVCVLCIIDIVWQKKLILIHAFSGLMFLVSIPKQKFPGPLLKFPMTRNQLKSWWAFLWYTRQCQWYESASFEITCIAFYWRTITVNCCISGLWKINILLPYWQRNRKCAMKITECANVLHNSFIGEKKHFFTILTLVSIF